MNALVDNDGGTVALGDSSGSLAINDVYQQSGAGTLEIEIDSTNPQSPQVDALNVQGNASVGSTLAIQCSGDLPNYGDSVSIATYGSRSGNFKQVTGVEIDSNITLPPIFGVNGISGARFRGVHCSFCIKQLSWEEGFDWKVLRDDVDRWKRQF